MSVLTRVAVQPDTFILGRTLTAHDGLKIEIERVVPIGEGFAPHLWIEGADADRIERLVREDDDVAQLERLDQVRGAVLFGIEWTTTDFPLFDALIAKEATCLKGVGTSDAWHFTLRFPAHEDLADFYWECDDHDISVGIEQVHENASVENTPVSGILTEQQYETLCTAFECGYFSVPREITLQELAEEMGISDTAASQRIRRGMERLLAEELVPTV